MNYLMITINYSNTFSKEFKRYHKKFASLKNEISEVAEKLRENPKYGVDLGQGLYKIRLAVSSKGKGKSGGFRIITYYFNELLNEEIVTLLFIYDKSEINDLPKDKLLKLLEIEDIKQQQPTQKANFNKIK